MSVVMEPTATRRSAAGRLVLEPLQTVGLPAVDLTDGEWLIGSDSQCAIHAQLRGLKPHHATITVRDGQPVLTPLDPRTWHNGGPLREDVPLREGDRITIGPLAFHVTKSEAPEPKLRDFAPREQSTEPHPAIRPPKQPAAPRRGNTQAIAQEDTAQFATSDADLIRAELQQVLARMEPLLEAQQHAKARNANATAAASPYTSTTPARAEAPPAQKFAVDPDQSGRLERKTAELDARDRELAERGKRLDAREKAQTRKTEQLAAQVATLQERERELLSREAAVSAQTEQGASLQARYQKLLQNLEEREQKLQHAEEAIAAERQRFADQKARLERQVKEHEEALASARHEFQNRREDEQGQATREKQLEQRAGELEKQAKHIADKEAELAALRQDCEQEKKNLESEAAKLRDERRQFEAERRKSTETPPANGDSQRELAELKRNQERCQQDQKELSERMREVAALQADCEQTRKRYQGRLSELDARAAELDKRQESLSQREQESNTQLEDHKALEKLRQKLARRQSRLKSAEQELIRSGTSLDQTCEDVLYRWLQLDEERVELRSEREWLDHEWDGLLESRRDLQRERDDLLHCEIALANTEANLEDALAELDAREARLQAWEAELAAGRDRVEPVTFPQAQSTPQPQPDPQLACELDEDIENEIVPATFVVDDLELEDSLPAKTSEPDPDASELVNLRSTLIEMFDLGAAAAPSPPAIPAEPSDHQGEEAVAPEHLDESPSTTETSRDESAPELVTARLFAERYRNAEPPGVNDEPVAEVAPPELAPEPAQPVAQAPAPESAEHCDLNDSIASFMQRLLGRSDKTTQTGASAQQNVPAHDAPHLETLAVGDDVCALVSSDGPPTLDTGPVRPIDKDAERANLTSFRAVANQSARAALAQHQARLYRRAVIWNAGTAALCLLGAAAFLAFTHVFAWLLPLAGALAAVGAWKACIAAVNWRRASRSAAMATPVTDNSPPEPAAPPAE